MIKDCESNSVISSIDLLHLDVIASKHYGHIESLTVKSGHVFPEEEMRLVVNPIACFSGLYCSDYMSFFSSVHTHVDSETNSKVK